MLTYEDKKALYSIWIDFVRKHATSKEAKAQLRVWACGSSDNCSIEEIDRYVKASKGSLKEYDTPEELPEVAQESPEVGPEDHSKKVKVRIKNKRYNQHSPDKESRQMSRSKILTERLTIRVRPEERTLMEEIATLEDDRTLTDFVRRVLMSYLNKYRKIRDNE